MIEFYRGKAFQSDCNARMEKNAPAKTGAFTKTNCYEKPMLIVELRYKDEALSCSHCYTFIQIPYIIPTFLFTACFAIRLFTDVNNITFSKIPVTN